MNYEDSRIAKLRIYLFSIIDTLTTNKNYQINADMLDNDINNYSLDQCRISLKINLQARRLIRIMAKIFEDKTIDSWSTILKKETISQSLKF